MNRSTGILLFAHGSSDPQWRAPFTQIHAQVSTRHTGPVALAFLEYMHPDFLAATSVLVLDGVTEIRVVPLFLAAGGHVRRCIPALIAQAQAQHPQVLFCLHAPLGEQASIVKACADFALSPSESPR